MRLSAKLFLLTAALLVWGRPVQAEWEEPPKISTEPIGSSFFRHLARETNTDLRELVKFEKHGFGRNEVCMLIVISSATNVPIHEYGKRRIKEKVSLHQLAMDAGLDFEVVHAKGRALKEHVEALGDENLPPPLYELPSPTPTPEPPKKKNKKSKKEPEKTPPLPPKTSELD